MTYDNKFFYDSLVLLRDQLHDLQTWSVYNDDKFNEELHAIDELVIQLQMQPTSALELEDAN